MTVNLYGKKDCGLCESAKDKLKKLEVNFQVFELTKFTEHHEGWRDDESVEVLACYSDIATLPVIAVDGKAMNYPTAMKLLKEALKAKPMEKVLRLPQPEEELAMAVG
jgi:glutaredoxin